VKVYIEWLGTRRPAVVAQPLDDNDKPLPTLAVFDNLAGQVGVNAKIVVVGDEAIAAKLRRCGYFDVTVAAE
jgi:hypothetical protein